MAGKALVTFKCEAKDFYNKLNKAALLKALGAAISKPVLADKTNFTTDPKATVQVSIDLTGTIVSLLADDKDNPKKLTLKLKITGSPMGAGGKAVGGSLLKAEAGGFAEGFNAKTMDQKAADVIDAVATALMENKLIPAMINLIP